MTRQNSNRFAVRIVLAVSLISSVQANASIEDAHRAIKAARYADGIAELRRLTAAGNARAEAELGWMTLMGSGLPRDPAKAKALITHAAGTGDRSAQLVLATMLVTSASDAGNDAQAERIVRKLAEQGGRSGASPAWPAVRIRERRVARPCAGGSLDSAVGRATQ